MVGPARSHQTGRSVFKALCCDGDGCIVIVVKHTCVGRAGCAVAAVGPLRGGGGGSGQATALLAMRWCLLVEGRRPYSRSAVVQSCLLCRKRVVALTAFPLRMVQSFARVFANCHSPPTYLFSIRMAALISFTTESTLLEGVTHLLLLKCQSKFFERSCIFNFSNGKRNSS